MIPTGKAPLDGTMRIDRHEEGCTISGDLYRRKVVSVGSPPQAVAAPAPVPDGRVPIFPIADYAYYLAGTALDEESDPACIRLVLRIIQYKDKERQWIDQGRVAASLARAHAPSFFPSTADFYQGNVTGSDGLVFAQMSMGWVAEQLRRVTIEIDSAAGCERPIDNGDGFGWPQLFAALKWDGTVKLSDTDVVEPATGIWPDEALHQTMLARREAVDLDSEWHYHILSVRRTQSADRGLMYDTGGTDSNSVPREGCALAAHWPVPANSVWGDAGGMQFGQSDAAFFRAAVHELGHAFGLDHSAFDLGFMNTSDAIAARATATVPFPRNIAWSFAPPDLVRLRHDPDIVVRPGGAPSNSLRPGTPGALADATLVPEGLSLNVTPLQGEIPIGAPVRINIALVNEGMHEQIVPARLSLKTEFVRGRVIDPSATTRTFSTMLGCIEECSFRPLQPGESFAYDLTLLRGPQGALFPMAGIYRIEVDVTWPVQNAVLCVSGSATIFVTSAQDAGHAAAAHSTLASRQLHPVLVFGASNMPHGLAALETALADPVLAPHYAAIELRRRNSPEATESSFVNCTSEEIVMSPSEQAKLSQSTTLPKTKSKPRAKRN